ncbi:MAG: family oxidoreductase [Herminiimonas sp.]|nr:family oxidoreductase [Herminiimonas sp.]
MNSNCPNDDQPGSQPEPRLDVWGGMECTVARIGDLYRNQIAETGHFDRTDDLAAVAALGIRRLRFPIVWETISPDHPDQTDWRWHDSRLEILRQLGVDPIAGLLHHGSGPRYTSLVDPAFPELLARHAERVAARYPWIDMYTPVNEPLTTARFSGLYGHWYPHGRDARIFLQALLNQCRATVLSMHAIRAINPHAKLVQTEDLGKVFSTPLLQYQADYENERRWLTFDLLCGRVDRTHPWFEHFLDAGIDAPALAFFSEHPCPPDIMGINHYLTSERFLDDRPHHYPQHHQAGNGIHQYADAEAVRIDLPHGETGPYARLKEAWERYRLPIAVTEAHHGCTRDEQLRWLMEVWNAANKLKAEGADIRAVTVWSLLGAVDWNTLLVEQNDFYESGVFDARCTDLRPTALAGATAALASHGKFDHPVLDRPGWWRRDERLYRPARIGAPRIVGAPRRLAITGATGTLGNAFSRICNGRGLDHELLGRADMDIAHPASVEAALTRTRPWAVINTAGFVRVAEASRNAERCYRENADGAETLARACARLDIPFVTFSSDLVFDGQLGRAYVESDAVSPVCVYGGSKAEAERRVLTAWPKALVIRTSAFFGPWDRYNFLYATLCDLASGKQVAASDAVRVSPTYVPDLVHAVLDLLIDGESGIWHLANRGMTSWHALASRAASEARLDTALLAKTGDDTERITALSSERGLLLPSLDSAIQRYVRESTVGWNPGGATAVAVA